MLTNDFTPAEKRLIEFIRYNQPQRVFDSVQMVLSCGISTFVPPRGDPEEYPAGGVCQAWADTTDILGILHAICMEHPCKEE